MKTPRMLLLASCVLGLTALPALAGDKSKDEKFRMMDADGDGRISRAEHDEGARQMFSQLDVNADGRVTAMEHGRSRGSDDVRADARGAGSGGHGDKAKDKIALFDQNNDGQLTTSEWQRGSSEKFNQMDANGDGYLSPEEMASGHKKHKDKRD